MRRWGLHIALVLLPLASHSQVGIGTTTSDGILHVDNGATDTDLIMEKDDGSSADIFIHNAGTAAARIGMDSNEDIYIENDNQDTDIIFKVNDGGVDTELMRLDASTARVGIGTTAPSNDLHIYDAATAILKTDGASVVASTGAEIMLSSAQDYRGRGVMLQSDDDDEWYFGSPYTGNGFTIGRHSSQPHYDANTKLFILETDYVGIGTGSVNHRLQVDDDIAGFAAYFQNDGDNTNREGIGSQSSADNLSTTGVGAMFHFYDGDGTDVGGIRMNSGTCELYSASDRRLKTGIKTTTMNGRKVIKELKIRDFNWKQNPDGPVCTGFIAQEVEEVYPKAVNVKTNAQGKEQYFVSPSVFLPVLIKTIQEQQDEIEELKKERQTRLSRLEELKNEYESLKK